MPDDPFAEYQKPAAGGDPFAAYQKPSAGAKTDAPGFGQRMLGTAVGMLKGLGHTASDLADIGETVSGGKLIQRGLEAVMPGGDKARAARVEGERQIGEFLKTTTPSQEVGYGAEQFLEYFAPTGAGEIKAAAGAGRMARLGISAARNALDVGVKTFVQTEDPKAAATSAAVGGAVGGAVEEGLPVIRGLLKKASESQYARVLHPLGRHAKEVAVEHVPEVVGRGYRQAASGSAAGLADKFSARAEDLGKQLESEYARLDLATKTNLKPVYDDFGKWVRENAYTKAGTLKDPKILEASLKRMKETQNALGPYLGDALPSTVQEVRQSLDRYVYKNGLTAEESVQAAASVREAMANSIRGQLNSQHPSIGALNKEFHLWRSMAELMERNITNEAGKFRFARNTGIVGRFLMGAAVGGGEAHREGAGIWGTGTAAVLMGLAMESPAWRTVSAVSKNKIANLITAGSAEAAATTAARLTGVALKPRTGSTPGESTPDTASTAGP